MNRQILFRGKRIIEPIKIDRYAPDGWVYGGLIEVDDEEAYILPYDISGEMYKNRPYRFRANDFEYTIMLAKVDTKTIGQFTGLTDKNGNKIFEGDIVKCLSLEYGYVNKEVYYTEGKAKFGLSSCGTDYEFGEYIDVEVIGNIYDSPELLEK